MKKLEHKGARRQIESSNDIESQQPKRNQHLKLLNKAYYPLHNKHAFTIFKTV